MLETFYKVRASGALRWMKFFPQRNSKSYDTKPEAFKETLAKRCGAEELPSN